MINAMMALSRSKGYTDATADEFGGLKGANCQVSKVDYDTDGNTILTFLWVNTSGKQIETEAKIMRGPEGKKGADGKDGSNGKGIKEVKFNEKNQLIVVFDDDTESKPIDMPATEIEISKATGNVAEVKADGLYVGATGVEISKDTDNAIETKTDGLFVKKTNDIEISTKDGNTLQNESDGLYVPKTDLTGYAKSDAVVAKAQGEANKGKVLGIDEDGNVTPTNVPTPDMSEYIKNATPQGYDVTIEADKNKGKDAIYIRTTHSDDDWNGEIRIDADGWIVGDATGQSYLSIIDARDKTKRYTPIHMKYDSEDDPAKVVAVSGDKFTFNGKDIATSDYVLADNNTNLNNLKRTGRYFFLHSRTYGNLPTNVVNGWLDVKVSDGASSVIKQVFYRQGTNNSNDFEVYERTFSTTWSDWVRLATMKDLGTKHTISYTNTSGQTKSITVYGS